MSQCWAHSPTRMRCSLAAGHDGRHSHSITWTEDECYTPSLHAKDVVPTPTITGNFVLPEKPAKQEITRCVACNHQHRGAECKCGCREFIG